MEVTKNDYVIGKSESGKGTVLFKVDSLHKGVASGIVQKDPHLKSRRLSVEIPVKDLLLNLGPDPHPGKVYGHDLSVLYRGRKTHDVFGNIYFFTKPEEELVEKLMKAFRKSVRILKANNLDFIIEPATCIWEITPNNGEKFAGQYRRFKDVEKSPHRLSIRPESMPASEWVYVVLHELGHHLRYEFLTGKKIRAQWINLFKNTIEVEVLKKEKRQELLKNLLQGENLPSEFKTSLSEEDTISYNLILKAIRNQHSVSVKDLDILFETDYKEEIKSLWPTAAGVKRVLKPLVTDYSCKNVEELFAESFAFKLTGKELPKSIEVLLEKSFSYARSNRERHKGD